MVVSFSRILLLFMVMGATFADLVMIQRRIGDLLLPRIDCESICRRTENCQGYEDKSDENCVAATCDHWRSWKLIKTPKFNRMHSNGDRKLSELSKDDQEKLARACSGGSTESVTISTAIPDTTLVIASTPEETSSTDPSASSSQALPSSEGTTTPEEPSTTLEPTTTTSPTTSSTTVEPTTTTLPSGVKRLYALACDSFSCRMCSSNDCPNDRIGFAVLTSSSSSSAPYHCKTVNPCVFPLYLDWNTNDIVLDPKAYEGAMELRVSVASGTSCCPGATKQIVVCKNTKSGKNIYFPEGAEKPTDCGVPTPAFFLWP